MLLIASAAQHVQAHYQLICFCASCSCNKGCRQGRRATSVPSSQMDTFVSRARAAPSLLWVMMPLSTRYQAFISAILLLHALSHGG